MITSPVAFLSKSNLLNNITVIRKNAPKSKIMIMLKANAYGHGMINVAKILDGKVEYFGVASLMEAILLRDSGITGAIVIMRGVNTLGEYMMILNYNLEMVVHDEEQLPIVALSRQKVNLWLKIDTGMHRLGFIPSEFADVHEYLTKMPQVKSLKLMTHLACADDVEHPMNKRQFKSWEIFTEEFSNEKSILNSAGVFNFPQHAHDIVRVGLAAYGLSPLKDKSATDLGLKPVMTLKAEVIALREIYSGDCVGYNATSKVPKMMTLATIAVGYGDGYPRADIDFIPVLLHNSFTVGTFGTTSMDLMTIDVTHQDVKVKDVVTLWGHNIPLETISSHIGRSPYEVVTSIKKRVLHRWI